MKIVRQKETIAINLEIILIQGCIFCKILREVKWESDKRETGAYSTPPFALIPSFMGNASPSPRI